MLRRGGAEEVLSPGSAQCMCNGEPASPPPSSFEGVTDSSFLLIVAPCGHVGTVHVAGHRFTMLDVVLLFITTAAHAGFL